MLTRRETLKMMGTALSLPVLEHLTAAETLAFGRALHARLETEGEEGRYRFETLDSHQSETVAVISELIIPETDTPGARAARVHEFIDLMLTDWFSDEDRERFLVGLTGLDEESRRAHGKNLLSCEESQQVALLKAQEEAAIAALGDRGMALVGLAGPPVSQPFFIVLKWLTLFGYFTSGVGMSEEMDYSIIPGEFDGCVPLSEV